MDSLVNVAFKVWLTSHFPHKINSRLAGWKTYFFALEAARGVARLRWVTSRFLELT